MTFQGRRVTTDEHGLLVGFGRPGDYGRISKTLEEVFGCESQLWWRVEAPDGSGCTLNPKIHTIVEHDDGTITVHPSIVTRTWHGWLKRGVWTSV